ncbi:MAG: hypothetical protein JSR37_00815 [Verrucomicrobia bacterium]|nr:hypothetical protein [Verrucomicrobiota bacterium]MBS0637296.1 hypothetical protein [Verrucomicrobiota bacterium]
MKKSQLIARIVAIVLAVMLALMLLIFYARKELSQAGIGTRQISPRELVGIAYFQEL